MAPPFGLTRAGSAPVSFSQASTTEANASLTSTTSMSSMLSPDLASAYFVAGMGADSIFTGSSPRTEMWWTRARGVRPYSASAFSLTTSAADAPSEICDATAAVSREPSASGANPAIFSNDVSRGHSSTTQSASATVSPSNRPCAIAALAR